MTWLRQSPEEAAFQGLSFCQLDAPSIVSLRVIDLIARGTTCEESWKKTSESLESLGPFLHETDADGS